MSGDRNNITRRAFAGGLALLGFGAHARAQGFAGLSESAADYAQVTPGSKFSFPADHGPHPDFRIEWWYVTANLKDGSGTPFGAQWTLFRQALAPGPQREGWATQQIWMAHAAVTRADTHRFNQTTSHMEPIPNNGIDPGTKFLMLNEGSIVFHGTTEELVHSKDPWIENYLA